MGKPFFDEMGVEIFEVCQHQQLLGGGIVPDVAFECGICHLPLLRRDPEKGVLPLVYRCHSKVEILGHVFKGGLLSAKSAE